MFCPMCGKANRDQDSFCIQCGHRLTPPVAPVAMAQPQAPVVPVAVVPQAQAPMVPMAVVPQPQAPVVPQAVVPQAQAPVVPMAQPQAPVVPQAVGGNDYYSAVPPMQQTGTLQYRVFGGQLPAVSVRLNSGESIYTQSGGMAWMDGGITMETNMKGGLMKGLGRMFSGDSLFMATYTSTAPGREIVIASTFPGTILALELRGQAIIAQRSAFLCAQPTVQLSAYLVKGLGAGLFGGEGFVLQRLTGAGTVMLEIDGSLIERVLAPGETIRVDTGNVAAYEESVQYQAEMVKGFKNILFGGEGLFLTTLTGPGKVWLQTMTLPGFAKSLIPFLPKPSN